MSAASLLRLTSTKGGSQRQQDLLQQRRPHSGAAAGDPSGVPLVGRTLQELGLEVLLSSRGLNVSGLSCWSACAATTRLMTLRRCGIHFCYPLIVNPVPSAFTFKFEVITLGLYLLGGAW